MAKDRHVTAEERRLWREITRYDEKFHLLPELPDEPATPASAPATALPRAAAPAPSPKQAPRASLNLLDARSAARLFRPHPKPQATLDLHGVNKLDAYEQVARFIDRCRLAGIRHAVIITGKGKGGEGVLRANLLHWLNEPRLRHGVSGVAHAPDNKGGSGVFHVLLKAQ